MTDTPSLPALRVSVDTSYTDDPICPYCGKAQRDAWEIDLGPGYEGDGEMACGWCEREFYISRHVAISYTTKPKEQPNG
jgi:uncharacterized Zn-finger protein